MKQTILALLMVALVSTPCFAQGTSTLSTELQKALDSAREELDIVGVSAAVITPDESLWLGVSGFSDMRPQKRMKPEMLFHIGSYTKTFITALVLQLIEEDILNFDDTVGEWLTDLPKEPYPWLDNTVTIRQLLKHRSGFSDPMGRSLNLRFIVSILLNPFRIWEPAEILRFVEEPFFPPGEGYQYSNTNYILLGMIIEKAIKSNVAVELRERFFDPLGLENTFLNIAEPVYGELAHMHLIGTTQGLADVTWFPRNALDSSGWTASGMLSTAGDLALWAQALFGGSVLSEESLFRGVLLPKMKSIFGK